MSIVITVTDGVLSEPYRIDKGCPFYMTFNVKNADGSAVDLSLASVIKFTVREGNTDSGKLVFEATTENNELTYINNKIEINEPETVLINWPYGVYNFSCKAYDTSGHPWKNNSLLKGYIELVKNTQQKRVGE